MMEVNDGTMLFSFGRVATTYFGTTIQTA